LDGDRILPAMAYTVMKLHKRYLIPMESLDEFCNYLQIKLEKDFCFDDDTVISTMERSMDDLKRAKLDYPGAPLPHELPRCPFGTFKEPSFTSKVLPEYLHRKYLSVEKYRNGSPAIRSIETVTNVSKDVNANSKTFLSFIYLLSK